MPAKPPRAAAAGVVVASLCAGYVVSQFYRSSVAVIAPDLARDVGLSPEELGALTGAFFLAFGVAQIPTGVLLDRFGPRRTIPAMLVFAMAGALVFAAATTPAALVLGRVLMGVGCASMFMGSLVVCARWFPADRFATLSALILALGGTGGLLSTTPLALAAETVGWRDAFVGTAAVTAAAGALIYLVVRDAPPGHPYHARTPERLGAVVRGVRQVLGDRRIPFLLAMAFVAYPVVATVLSLWAGPYLADVHGLSAVARGNVLLGMAAALIAGTLCYGPLDRVFDSRKRVVVGGALACVAILAALALAPAPAVWQVAVLFALLGAAGAYSVVVLAHGRAIFPERLVGRAVTMVNFAGFTGVAAMQMVTGLIIGAFPAENGAAPEVAYRVVFGFLAAAVVLALAAYVRVDDARPSAGVPADTPLTPRAPRREPRDSRPDRR